MAARSASLVVSACRRICQAGSTSPMPSIAAELTLQTVPEGCQAAASACWRSVATAARAISGSWVSSTRKAASFTARP